MTTFTPHKPTLLLVDDQVLNIQLLHHIFKDDYTICSATTGAQALALCARQIPDLILLDVMMPVMDGHQVCTHLKSDPRTRDIPIIFVTGHNDPEEESAALKLGAVDFISKPVNAAVVKARVSSQLMLRQTLRQVQDLNHHLEERVAQRTAELERALEHLQQSQEDLAHSAANATLSTLIAGVSHELGTPLGNCKVIAGTLAEHTRDMVRDVHSGQVRRAGLNLFMEQVKEGVSLLQRNLERSVELLGNFRQVAADQASEQRRVFDLGHVVNEILHTLSPSLKRHPHQVVVDIPEGISMDSLPGPLGQIVINLVNNAYLHAFEGRSDGVLNIQAQVEGDQLRLRFVDNGVGMATELLHKLFVPFFSTKIGRGGTGLGMAIVKNLVTKTLGGSIDVSSTVGEGTRFDLVLPLTLPAPKTH
ncbi:MAG: hybrid sensor histidine kinase/response regulator [Pseudomonadota bacterium]